MYKIADDIKDLSILEDYGFKQGFEIPDHQRCICNERDYDNWWLIPMNPDDPYTPYYANEEEGDQVIWSIQVMDDRTLYIDCVPSCTYHISNYDMKEMFSVLYKLIKDYIIVDVI